MTEPIQFQEFKKIPRLKRNITITEKIDGTNACVIVWHHAARSYYKVLLENDDKHKGEA